MSTPPNPTRTRHPERRDGMGHGKAQDGVEPPRLPTPRDRPHPSDGPDPGVGGGWGRQSGEATPEGPEDGDGY